MLPILRPLVHVIANRMMLLRTGNASYMVVLAIIVIIVSITIIIIIVSIIVTINMMMQECEDPSYVAVLASHTAHRAANKAVASNTVAISNFEKEKEEVEDEAGGRSKRATRAFNLCEQASEFLEAAVRFVSISSFIMLFTTLFWSFGSHAYRIVNKESIRFTFGTRTMIRFLSCLIGFLSCFECTMQLSPCKSGN